MSLHGGCSSLLRPQWIDRTATAPETNQRHVHDLDSSRHASDLPSSLLPPGWLTFLSLANTSGRLRTSASRSPRSPVVGLVGRRLCLRYGRRADSGVEVAGALCASASGAYAATRLIAFPQIGDDVGNWLERWGVVSSRSRCWLSLLRPSAFAAVWALRRACIRCRWRAQQRRSALPRDTEQLSDAFVAEAFAAQLVGFGPAHFCRRVGQCIEQHRHPRDDERSRLFSDELRQHRCRWRCVLASCVARSARPSISSRAACRVRTRASNAATVRVRLGAHRRLRPAMRPGQVTPTSIAASPIAAAEPRR